TVCLIDDDPHFCRALAYHLEENEYEVETFHDGESAIAALANWHPNVILLDMELPDLNGLEVLKTLRQRIPQIPVVMITGTDDVPTVVTAMNAGAFDYLVKPVQETRLITATRNAIDRQCLADEVENLQRCGSEAGFMGMTGSSVAMRKLHSLVEQVAQSDVSVVIYGESGTGKELVARGIHDSSPRAKGPFVAVNCSAIPELLQEDEFFGHERGAFTGALARRRGRFELADKGTLFLDEIAELSPSLQSTLLRVLEERTFSRVGDSEECTSDFRLIAATHTNLYEAVQKGEFREDLFYRIAVFEIDVPSLRSRPEDIPALATRFLREVAAQPGADTDAVLDVETISALVAHDWPGNVRELRNAVQRSFVASNGSRIQPKDLPARIANAERGPNAAVPTGDDERSDRGTSSPDLPSFNRDELERLAIEQVLERCGGDVSRAARTLGLSRATLYRRRKRYGLL
ncbi:MAG: sigma-54 dependent transcriptional regulator, partial [Myxococcota bacterium]